IWFARLRLRQLAERACDDWALCGGASPAEYADALLSLTPQRRPGMALAAVSSRGALLARVKHILGAMHRDPQVGAAWLRAAIGAFAAALALIALARPRATQAQEGK